MLHAARLSLVLVIVLTMQTTWMADLAIAGVPGDLLLLVAITGGLAAGAYRGATIGFAAGMLLDLVAGTPLGLAALVYLAVGYVVGSLHEGVIRSAPWIPVTATALATMGALVAYVLAGRLIGEQFRLGQLPPVLIVTTAINTLLSMPALWVMRWVDKAARPPAAFGAR